MAQHSPLPKWRGADRKAMKKIDIKNLLKTFVYVLFPVIGGSMVGVSCSEETEESSEFDNWQARNETFFASLEDSLSKSPTQWLKLKNYSLDATTEGTTGDYVYAKVISSGTGTDSPMFTDSLRLSYEGRLIPSATYPAGYIFDGTAYGTYNDATNATTKMVMVQSGYEALIPGWITALLHMHRGDHWRVYIPQQLAYGSDDKTSDGIPPYSTLIFDITLVDFSPAGEVMPAWSARQMR